MHLVRSSLELLEQQNAKCLSKRGTKAGFTLDFTLLGLYDRYQLCKPLKQRRALVSCS